MGKEKPLGSWWEGGVWDTPAPAKPEGHSLAGLQVLLAAHFLPQLSLTAQSIKREEAELENELGSFPRGRKGKSPRAEIR